jgi:hypothetical protein
MSRQILAIVVFHKQQQTNRQALVQRIESLEPHLRFQAILKDPIDRVLQRPNLDLYHHRPYLFNRILLKWWDVDQSSRVGQIDAIGEAAAVLLEKTTQDLPIQPTSEQQCLPRREERPMRGQLQRL